MHGKKMVTNFQKLYLLWGAYDFSENIKHAATCETTQFPRNFSSPSTRRQGRRVIPMVSSFHVSRKLSKRTIAAEALIPRRGGDGQRPKAYIMSFFQGHERTHPLRKKLLQSGLEAEGILHFRPAKICALHKSKRAVSCVDRHFVNRKQKKF